VAGLSKFLFLPSPAWTHETDEAPDNWQTSAWDEGDKNNVHF